MINVTFDVLSLQNATAGIFATDSPDLYDAPPIDVQDEKLAETDGSVIVKRLLGPKTITINGYMQTADVPSMDALIDLLKKNLNKQNQNLDIDYNGSTRRYTATMKQLAIARQKGLNTATWSAQFLCVSPVGADITSSSLLGATTITSSNQTASIINAGTYMAQPDITVTVNSFTGTTTNTITVSNDKTLRGISVSRTWLAGDLLEIDCLNKLVFVNNAAVAFTGQFPTWDPDNGGINYIDDFSARSITLAATYTARFL